jgi:bifunctional non-homologous end joining protein LigD
MALEKYREKRDFTKSPEPSGERAAPRRGEPLFFCVQKHLASHLHYDFRLEHRGVLLSWAVPKGPAIDPSIKRFATQVEDHPFDYGEFEGVIPEGYGAGIVMLWDKGTWEPEVADIDAALKKGDLKFRLNGFKMKGSWVLVRTRGGPGGDRSNWLLIKHRDEWSGPIDLTEAFPASVKSGGDFADILSQNNPEIWISNRPARGGQAGEMFEKIVARALAMRDETRRAPAATLAERAENPKTGVSRGTKRAAPGKPAVRKTSGRKTTTARKTAAKKTAAKRTTGKTTAAKTTTAGRAKRSPRG